MAETGTQNITEVTEASSIATGDNIYLNHSNQLQQIDYDKLATAILNKLSTQSFSSLETTAKTVLGGINELNSKILKTGTFDIAYGKTNTILRPSYLKDVLIVGGRLEIGFLIYFPRNSSEYYQVSNSGILESVSVDNKNISLVLGAEGYGSSLLCSYIVL